MKGCITKVAATTALLLGVAVAAPAVAQGTDAATTTANVETRDDDMDYGWVGLLGLLGLMGLKRKREVNTTSGPATGYSNPR